MEKVFEHVQTIMRKLQTFVEMFTTDECRRKAQGDGLGITKMNETTSTPLRLCLLEVTGSSVFCTEVMTSADSCGSNASASFAATRQGLHKQSLHW